MLTATLIVTNLLLIVAVAIFAYKWRKAASWECDCDECSAERYFANWVPSATPMTLTLDDVMVVFNELEAARPYSNGKIVNLSPAGLSMPVEFAGK